MCLEYTVYGDIAAATTEEGILQIAAITTLLESFFNKHKSMK